MAAGRPVITTAVGEIAHIVAEQGCGSVVPDLNPETLRKALAAYFDQYFWHKQAQAGYDAAISEYNWEKAKANLIGLYQELGR
jgi:glycosyltransferase involved in cell wall biosynthesis